MTMIKYILGIDGMKCAMCEIHVEEALEKRVEHKRVNASHLKNEVVVISPLDLTQNDFKLVLDPTGYRITSFKKEEAKHTLFGWK